MNIETAKKEKTLSLLDLLLILAKHWKFIFFGTLSGMLFIILYSAGSLLIQKYWGSEKSYLPNFYTPTATILFDEESLGQEAGGLLALMGQAGSPPSKAGRVELLLKANSVIDEIIDSYGLEKTIEALNLKNEKYLKQKIRQILKNNLTVRAQKDTNSVEISFTHYNPRFAEAFLTKAMEILEKKYKELAFEKIEGTNLYLNENLSQTEHQIKAKMKELNEFQRKNNVIDPVQQLELKSKILIQLELEIEKNRMLRNKLAGYQGWNSPQVLQIQKEIDEQELSYKIQKGEKQVNSQYNLPLPQLMSLSSTFYQLKKELDGLETLYVKLKVQQQSNIMELNNKSSTFQIIDKPTFFAGLAEDENPSEMPMKAGPSRGKLCILFTAGVFFFLIIISFLLEFLQTIKQNEEEIDKINEIKRLLPSFKRRKMR